MPPPFADAATATGAGFDAERPDSDRVFFCVDTDDRAAGFVRVAVAASTPCGFASTERVSARVMSSSALP